MSFFKNSFLIIFPSIIVSLLLIYLSTDNHSWNLFWSSLSIPPQIPFSDLKAHIHFYQCYLNGIDIYTDNCSLIPQGNANISTHPKIWLHLVSILNLDNENIYNFFIFLVFTFYFIFLISIFRSFKNFDSKFLFLIFTFSTTNFILLERFATDIIIFIIVFVILNINNKKIQACLIFFGILLKYYPVFLTSIFIENKKYLIIISSIFSLFLIFFYADQIKLVSSNILEVALMTAYGARSISKAIYHLSNEYDFFFKKFNYEIFRDALIYLSVIYSSFLVTIGYIYQCKLKINLSEKFNIYFLGGSSLYIGTYIFGSNFDYRIIFLIFTIPYILNIKNSFLRNLIIISYVFSLNSFLFQHNKYLFPTDIKHSIYYLKTFIIYMSKFIILTVLSYLLGSYCKKINFFSFYEKK